MYIENWLAVKLYELVVWYVGAKVGCLFTVVQSVTVKHCLFPNDIQVSGNVILCCYI